MGKTNFTFVPKWLFLLAISLVSFRSLQAQQRDLIIATNAEIIMPTCTDEITYYYFFTVVDDDPNGGTLSTPTVTNLGYTFTGPNLIDSYDVGTFNYATYEIAVTVPAPAIGTTVNDCFTITYEGESVNPCFDVTKSGDPKPQIVMNPQTITIPDCQASVDAVFGVTILSCDETASTPTFNFLGSNHTPGFSQAGDGYFRYTVNIPISAIGTNVATISYTDGEGRNTSIPFLVQVLGNVPTTDYSNLSCTGQVNIKLDDNCEAHLSATQLLNGAVVCDDLFDVHVVYVVGNRSYINRDGVISDPFYHDGGYIDLDKTCIQFIYRVYYDGDLVCWGYVNAEDKTAPG